MELFDLSEKVAIVTGCSRLNGLGYGMAEGLAEAGAHIAGVARSDLSEVQQKIESIGRSFLAINEDLGNQTCLSNIVKKTLERFGKVDILINNAGIIRRNKALEFPEKDWDDVLDVNLKSLFFLSQAVAKVFKDNQTGGKIINIASMLTYQGGILVPSYTASKHAVAGVTKALCNEWAKYHININAIAPGYMATDNTAPLRKDAQRNKAILERIPAGRWGNNVDLKGTAIFLASSASDYLNGAIIPVDGGWLAR